MFQFSEDDDVDVENLLKLPHEKTLCNDTHSTEIPSSNDFDTILDDFDDNELILSVIDKVDNTKSNVFAKSNLNSSHSKNTEKCIEDVSVEDRLASVQKIVENSTNKHKLSTVESLASKAPRVEYERKFPGPAGLIPKNVDSKGYSSLVMKAPAHGSPLKIEKQRNDNILFENNCWNQLVTDTKLLSPKLQAILDENSVASVKRMNIVCSKPRKLPIFAAVIIQIDCTLCDPSIVLKDSTGEIHGTIHKDLWENHSSSLIVGTALLLKQVSVLTITNSRKLYVNVTSNNIVKIYTPQSNCRPVLVTSLMTISEEDFIQPVRKNERIVFEETHPNKLVNSTKQNLSSASKDAHTHRHSSNTVVSHKTDTAKLIANENEVPSNIKCVPSTPQLPSSKLHSKELVPAKLPVSSQIPKDLIFNELEGIDADSLFGEF